MASSKTTTDHDEIRRWAEERGGRPAHVKDTGSLSRARTRRPAQAASLSAATSSSFDIFERPGISAFRARSSSSLFVSDSRPSREAEPFRPAPPRLPPGFDVATRGCAGAPP